MTNKRIQLPRLPDLAEDVTHMSQADVDEVIDFRNDVLLDRFEHATPLQVMAWFDANVTDLPSALTHLRRLTRLSHYLLRRQCRSKRR